MNENWVQAWGQSHSALSFFYYPSCKKTFRLVMHSAISGNGVRVRFSNKCGKNPVTIGAVTASLCDENGTCKGTPSEITVDKKNTFTIAIGGKAISDGVSLKVNPGDYFCVSVYVTDGSLTSGNLLSNVNIITAKGNRVNDLSLPNEPRIRDSVRAVACKVLGMFLHKPIPVFDSVELLNDTDAGSIVVFGDSISQQGFWTNALDNRIRENFPGRYSVINKSIMGNRVLRDYSPKFICKGLFGQRGTERINDDVSPYDDVEYVVFALGINDFLQYGTITTPKSEKPDLNEFYAAIKNITAELKSRGIKVVMLTMLPFGDFADYKPEKEELRSAANKWLRENKELFDGFYDQAAVCALPDKEAFINPKYVGSDKLHPNEVGGQFIADSMDLSVFKAECID